MEWLQTLLDNSTIPIITAFLLGILTAISPCPLATNITAVGYISRDITNRNRIFLNGILYTLGRVIAYFGLGLILIPILQEGASIFIIQKYIAKYGEILLAPALILIGLYLLFGDKINLPNFGISINTQNDKWTKKGMFGALLLGFFFAMIFCPSSGVLYFGMLIPMSATVTGGIWLPLVFAIATGLPVIIVGWILAYSISELGAFYKKLQTLQKWMNLIIGLLFIAIGIYYAFIFYF